MDYKYLQAEQIATWVNEHTQQECSVEKTLEEKGKEDHKAQLNSEYEAHKYLQAAIEAY